MNTKPSKNNKSKTEGIYSFDHSKAKYQSLMENIPGIVISITRDGVIQFINRVFDERPINELLGTSIYQFCEKKDIKGFRNCINSVWETREGRSFEINKMVDGQEHWYVFNINTLIKNDQVNSLILLITDISDRKKAEKILINAHEELESSVEERATELLKEIEVRKEVEQALLESEKQLLGQKIELERKNLALQEVLGQIEIEKKQIKDDILSNVDELILPQIKNLKKNLKKLSMHQVEILEQSVRQLTSSFCGQVSKREWNLTPREIEICNMIKNGLSSKEISDLINISFRTVELHRHNIRKKIKIANKNVNLTSFLQSI